MTGAKARCPGCGAEAGVSIGYRLVGNNVVGAGVRALVEEASFCCEHAEDCPIRLEPSPCVMTFDGATGSVRIAEGLGNEEWFENEFVLLDKFLSAVEPDDGCGQQLRPLDGEPGVFDALNAHYRVRT